MPVSCPSDVLSCCFPKAFYQPDGGNYSGNYNPAVPAASSVLSPMAAYFDGPASFFSSSGSAAMGCEGRQSQASQVTHETSHTSQMPQARASQSQEQPQRPSQNAQTQRQAPMMHASMCMQPGMGAPFMPYPPQNMQSGVPPMAPVSPGLQPPMCMAGPTLLQSRTPPNQAKKKEKDSEPKRSQGRAPCPIAVYVDLSSLRLRDKK